MGEMLELGDPLLSFGNKTFYQREGLISFEL